MTNRGKYIGTSFNNKEKGNVKSILLTDIIQDHRQNTMYSTKYLNKHLKDIVQTIEADDKEYDRLEEFRG